MLGSFPYLITVEAVGFTPVNFTFTISGEPGVEQPRIYRVPVAPASSSVTFGADPSLFFFEPVPLDLAFYVATLDITALGTDGADARGALHVRRPQPDRIHHHRTGADRGVSTCPSR